MSHLTPKFIIKQVANYHCLNERDLYRKSRALRFAEPRMIAIYLIKKHLPGTYLADIGRLFKGLHHSTVIHALNTVTQRMKIYKDFEFTVKHIESRLVENAVAPLDSDKADQEELFNCLAKHYGTDAITGIYGKLIEELDKIGFEVRKKESAW